MATASQGPLGVGDTFTGKTRLPGAWRGVGRGRGDGTLAEGTVNHDEKKSANEICDGC